MNTKHYTTEQKEKFFDDLMTAIGDEGLPLRKALKKEGMMNKEIFYELIDSDKNKAERYARANKLRAEKIFEEIIDISEEETDTNRNRLRIDARKWVLSKMQPKVYGDKIDVTTDGEKFGNLAPIILTPIIDEDAQNSTTSE